MRGKMRCDCGMRSFGFESDSVVQEFGFDDDVAEDIRAAIEGETGEELADEDYEYVADGAIAWWRKEDGDADDLADLLLDMKANLADEAAVCWLFVPGPNDSGHVPADVIEEAAVTAGLQATSARGEAGWSGVRLIPQNERR